MPPELWHRHGRHGGQGNEGSRARDGVPEGRAAREGHREGQRRGARQVPVGRRHGARADEELRPVQVADALQDARLAEEVRQDVRRDRARTTARSTATGRSRTSRCAARDRWNFLFIAGMWFQDLFNYDFRRTERCIIPYATQEGRDQLLRLQHGHRLAEHHREDAHDGDAHQVVRRARPSRDLRRRQEGRARHDRSTASSSTPRR